MNENSYLEECIRMIERKMDWGPSGNWTAYHFTRLSQEIYTKTGKTVSDSTLKRLFGKKDTSENYTPQLYTRDAIAVYLGYTDWQHLIADLKIQSRKGMPKQKKNRKAIVFKIASVIGIAVVLLVINPLNTRKSAFLKKTDTLSLVPYTAVFQYDITGIQDSVFIDFGNNTLIPLPEEKNTITEFYKACGIFYPKILTRKKILDSVKICNFSAGWQGGYSPNDDYRKFIPFEDPSTYIQSHRLYIPPDRMKFSDPVYEKGIYAEYRYMYNFNLSLDSLKLEAVLKNSPAEGGKLCYDVEIWLLGSEENCRVRFVEPGCYRYGQLKIGEKEYNGRFDDLSSLARDMKTWAEVVIHTGGSQAEIFYNGESILKESYRKSMGKLLGLYFRFYGTGSIKNVILKNTSDQIIYQTNFLKT